MKIAIALYGHMRTYKSTYEYLSNNILQYHEHSIYIHTWSLSNHNNVLWDGSVNIVHKIEPSHIEHTYKTDNIIIDDQEKIKNLTLANDVSLRYYSINTVLKMIDSSKYDAIVLTRPDVLLKRKIILNHTFSNAQQVILYPLSTSIKGGKIIISGSDLLNIMSTNYPIHLSDQSSTKSKYRFIDDGHYHILKKAFNKVVIKETDVAILRESGKQLHNIYYQKNNTLKKIYNSILLNTVNSFG